MSVSSPEVLDNILVVKVGTSSLLHEQADRGLDTMQFIRIGRQVLDLCEQGKNVVVVSSGAIAAGMHLTGTKERPDPKTNMLKLRKLASNGWKEVEQLWKISFGDRHTGGLLLTRNEIDHQTPERDKALRLLYAHLADNEVPIVNENDAIADEEITFGDNDILAAILAVQIKASPLFGDNVEMVMLTDREGILEDTENSQSVIRNVGNIESYSYLNTAAPSDFGSGGIPSKFEAARITTAAGIDMWVANGRAENAISRALAGEIGTHFVAKQVVTA